jgi:hypothetical protein
MVICWWSDDHGSHDSRWRYQRKPVANLKIPALAALIAESWTRAEQSLRERVRQESPDRDEEIITDLFHTALEAEFSRVSALGSVERAFQADLRRALPGIPAASVSRLADGLIAMVHFHPREVESRSGGDFGLVLIRPEVNYAKYSRSALTIEHDCQRGLLCQAKVFRRNSTWGSFSRKQRSVLQARLNYLSLVLYRYRDQDGERRDLWPFGWQLTRDASIRDVAGWLRNDQFPKLEDSRGIISALAEDRIGTDDKQVIAEQIAPPLRPSMEIKILWRDGKGPGAVVHLHQTNPAVRERLVMHR